MRFKIGIWGWDWGLELAKFDLLLWSPQMGLKWYPDLNWHCELRNGIWSNISETKISLYSIFRESEKRIWLTKQWDRKQRHTQRERERERESLLNELWALEWDRHNWVWVCKPKQIKAVGAEWVSEWEARKVKKWNHHIYYLLWLWGLRAVALYQHL